MFITMAAINGISDAFSEFTSIFNTAWSFIMGNWYFAALILVPLGCLVIGTILSFVRR